LGWAATGLAAGSLANKLLIQPNSPLSAGAVTTTGAAAATGAAVAAARTGSGRGVEMGAGASGSTPLMTGVCLLVGSCERRVTAVASSASSTIL
jgi:hypothetical protein